MTSILPSFACVVAISLDGAIGHDNQLLWHLPDDLRFFKSVTMGHALIMGRNTYTSIGKPLPGRQTIVLSRKGFDAPEGVLVVPDLEHALRAVESGRTAFVVGGAQLYEQAMPMAETVYLTRVHANFPDAEARINPALPSHLRCTAAQHHPADQQHAFSFDVETWQGNPAQHSTSKF
jgi:dihydrofolate reductase